jgi:hypothetical protein
VSADGVQATEDEDERVRHARQRQLAAQRDQHRDAAEQECVLQRPIGAIVRRDGKYAAEHYQ